MSWIQRQSPAPRELPKLDPETAGTFRGAPGPGLLAANGTLFRYGSTQDQALRSTRDWINLSEDCFRTSQEVIESLCLLDMTAPGAREWNTAGWRAMFVAKVAIPVWYGLAGPMAFDVFSGKR